MLIKVKIVLLPIFMLAIIACLNGCENELPVTEQPENVAPVIPSGPHPLAVVENDTYEFGSMEVGETKTHEFVIRNEGEADLHLKKDRTTCKCTAADFEEATLAPGESFTIELSWEGKFLDPTYSHGAYLSTNDPAHEEIALKVKGRVDSIYEISPTGEWNIGEMNSDKPTEFNGKITSRVREQFELISATCENPLVSVDLVSMDKKQLAENDAKSGFLIQGKIALGVSVGTFSEQVTLKILVGEKEERELSFKVQGYFPGPYRIIGPYGWSAGKMEMLLGRFPAREGKTVKLSMFVRDNTGPPVEITEVVSNPEFLKFTLKKDDSFKAKNRERYHLSITVPPGSPPRQFYKENPAEIKVVTNNPEVGTMVIKIQMLSF